MKKMVRRSRSIRTGAFLSLACIHVVCRRVFATNRPYVRCWPNPAGQGDGRARRVVVHNSPRAGPPFSATQIQNLLRPARSISPVFFLPNRKQHAVPVPPETLPPNRVRLEEARRGAQMVRYRPWTEGDVARLRHMAERYPAELIAERLGRRLREINMKAHELRIPLMHKFESGLDPGPAGMDLKS